MTIVVHDIKQMNREIRTGQYFYSDVINEGALFYDSRRHMLARPKAQNAGERLDIARKSFGGRYRGDAGSAASAEELFGG